jgi:branched-chain amino acid transport system substrate-binding protein
MLKHWTTSLFLVGALGIVAAAAAGKQYAPGVSDTEIKIGNTMPYSGATSPYGSIGKSEAAYFRMVNEQGGITGARSTSSAATMPPAPLRRWKWFAS